MIFWSIRGPSLNVASVYMADVVILGILGLGFLFRCGGLICCSGLVGYVASDKLLRMSFYWSFIHWSRYRKLVYGFILIWFGEGRIKGLGVCTAAGP